MALKIIIKTFLKKRSYALNNASSNFGYLRKYVNDAELNIDSIFALL